MTSHPNYNTAVENMQRYLRLLSYSEPTIPLTPVDGIFERDTENALREFQRLRGLPVTGNADLETWERLYADYRAALAATSPPRRVAIFPASPLNYALDIGSTGFPVAALQYMLRELHQKHIELAETTPTGTYDEPTKAAVRIIQQRVGLSPTGATDLLTWNIITDLHNALDETDI